MAQTASPDWRLSVDGVDAPRRGGAVMGLGRTNPLSVATWCSLTRLLGSEKSASWSVLWFLRSWLPDGCDAACWAECDALSPGFLLWL